MGYGQQGSNLDSLIIVSILAARRCHRLRHDSEPFSFDQVADGVGLLRKVSART